MSTSAVANRYALALFQVAKEKKLLDVLESELRVVKDVLNANKGFSALLSTRKLSKDKKKRS